MSFGQFFSILRARWVAALSILLGIVILTVLISLVWPRKYTAYASVVVDVKPDPVSAIMYAGLGGPSFMATQVDVMQSDRVALRVVRDLKLADNPQVRQQWRDDTGGEGSIELWLADSFQRSMDVKPSKESNVLTVSYKAPDPKFAAGLANAFVQAYIETTLELRVDPAKQYTSFFDTRTKEAKDALDRAQTKLSAYQKEKGIIATDERLDVENARLNDLSSQLVMVQSLAADSESRQAQARGSSGADMQEVLNNGVVGSLKADLSRAQANLEQLNARYGANHPQVIEAKANIAELRARLDAETRRVTGSVGLNNAVNRQRESQIRNDLEAQRAKVLRMKAVRDEGLSLVHDVEAAQKNLETIQARLTQTSLESQTTQSNVYVLTQAIAPNEPSSPKLVLNALVAVFFGTMLAVGGVLLWEFLDRRLRAVDDVAPLLGLPVIGVLPKVNARKLMGRNHPTLMQQRMVGRLSAPGKGA
ncbi:MAG: chain length determinant protein EpsF [Proteobacteria bacterium]|nr:chain length determinant protein EpsF [Pseudomonadota bacterium]